jgi:hypothetical protein
LNFNVFKSAVAAQFERMQKHPMFRVAVEKDDLWSTYLAAFPAGTNPKYRERTEHDCTCCKQFIRTVGDVVAIIDGEMVSIWDVTVSEPGYQTVANVLALLVRGKPIANPFLHYEAHAGTDKSFEQMLDGSHPNNVKQWDHFFVNIKKQFVMKEAGIATKLSELRTAQEMLVKSCTMISDEAIDTVLELIAQNSLYRGEEHKFAVTEFSKVRREYLQAPDQTLFAWTTQVPGSVSSIKNTSIGTLLVNLSEGMELEAAVRAFEKVVAPSNYKRPTALVTPGMIAKAKEKVAELGLTSALQRRYAVLPDITVNNVLFADRDARKVMTNDVFDELSAATSSRVKSMDKIEQVTIDKFITDILPVVKSVEVLLENRHTSNLVSLIAPSDPTAGQLFKWGNNFSWSYNGEVADSIKEKVKAAGGNVTGDLCCRLAWHNYDDLDFHLREPDGSTIWFRSKTGHSSGGKLDVDMNAGGGQTREPVENIFYGDRRRMQEGVYTLMVNQWSARDAQDPGFEVEIDYLGAALLFAHPKKLRTGDTVTVAKFKYTHAGGLEIIESLPSSQAVRNVWGLPTQTFHKVNVALLSPNHWDEQGVGNRHYFFMLDGCVNDGSARGFFNEFLDSRLDPHRKVFEMVGSKLKPEASANQLSGLGFSSTQRSTLTVRVKGSFTRTLHIAF